MAQLSNIVGWAGVAVAVACGGSTNTPTSSTFSTGGNASGGAATSVTTTLTAGAGTSNAAGSGAGGTNTYASGGASTSTAPGGSGGTVTSSTGATASTGGNDGQSTGSTGFNTGGNGTGGSSGSGGSGGSSGGTVQTCAEAPCCQPITLNSNTVWATVSGKNLSITILVVRGAGTDPYWDVQADVTVPGGQVTCNSSRESSYTTYSAIQCPMITFDTAPACDTTLSLRIHLRSSTYASYSATDASCAGAGSMEIEVQQPVTCPKCPASLVPPSNEPCDIPGRECPASMLFVNCPCYLDRETGERKWSCPTP